MGQILSVSSTHQNKEVPINIYPETSVFLRCFQKYIENKISLLCNILLITDKLHL